MIAAAEAKTRTAYKVRDPDGRLVGRTRAAVWFSGGSSLSRIQSGPHLTVKEEA